MNFPNIEKKSKRKYKEEESDYSNYAIGGRQINIQDYIINQLLNKELIPCLYKFWLLFQATKANDDMMFNFNKMQNLI